MQITVIATGFDGGNSPEQQDDLGPFGNLLPKKKVDADLDTQSLLALINGAAGH